MAKGIKVNQGTSNAAGVVAAGAVVSMIVMLIGISVCASLISAETISAGSADYCVIGILLLSALAGAATAIGKRGQKRLYMGLAVGAVYLLVLLALTALFFDGQYQGVLVTAIAILGGATLAALLPGKQEMKGKSRRSKKRRR